ncbi:bacterial Ig-like domain-containing protein [Vagococcus carniphilus]|uniref:Ig-like domain-containing protein n=1 Tax=Vagococcus carniphilus TaxID=218144 RepID=A0A430AWE2_9ENTE|nr:bacterial Ig-like domain-containing protein [Vagococcus carniphilus]QNN72179.1 bacterial Ig-like domain-containing protein [Vagococcus carniphilus]RSU12377.1 hypothetical protein CBF28_11095 [Vagococcus carniphilus]
MKKIRMFIVATLLCSLSTPLISLAETTQAKPKQEIGQNSKATLKVKNSKISLNSKWVPENNFEAATDESGKKLSWNDVNKSIVVSGKVDTTKIGTYKITYKLNKMNKTATVEVFDDNKPIKKAETKKNRDQSSEVLPTALNLKNTVLKTGQTWNPESNFDSVVMSDGSKLLWSDISKEVIVTGSVDTTKAGTYKVTYNFRDFTKVATVTVEADVTAKDVVVKDSKIDVGSKWDAKDNFEYVLMSDGSKLLWSDISKEVIVTGSVDTAKAGTYKVTYNFRDFTKVATVTVEANVTAKDVVVKDSKIDVGSKWDAKDNFEYVLMSDGSKLSWSDVSKEIEVTGSVDTKKAGTYKVTYNYRDIKKVATIIVEANVTAKDIVVKDSKIDVGSKWDAKDNFEYVLMSDGSKLSWSDVSKEIEVTGSVDTKKAGTYKVTYNYRDIKKVATIIVEANVTAKDVVVKDSKIDVGSKWDAKDNFEYVLMSNGSKLSWSDVSKEIEVTGSVDTKKAGTYKVTYTYRDIKKVATVTVKKQNEVTAKKLVVRDTKIFVDSKWNVKDNFNYVLMSDGSKLLWKDVEREITVDGKVNTQKAGTYKITYKFRGLTNVAKITVEEVKAKSLILKDTTLVVGSKWNAKDNFEYVLMNNGTKLSWTDVEKEILIFGEVNTQKAGTYKVTYECRDLKKVATITVKQSGKPVSGTSVGNKPTASKPVTTKPVKPLPQTSETNNSELLIIGILMISGVFILVSFKLRKETN